MARRKKDHGGVSWPPAEGVLQDVTLSAPALNPAERIAEQYTVCFSTEAGQFVLNDLKLNFGDRRSYVPDSNATAFHEGQRDVYRMIEIMLQKDQARSTNPPTEESEHGS